MGTLIKRPKNIPFGFKSTWRFKSHDEQKHFDENIANVDSIATQFMEESVLTKKRKFMSEFKKIKSFDEVQSDPYNIEIPTKKIKTLRSCLSDFTRLAKLMNEYGYIHSSRSFNSHLEGGGHIHLDYQEIFGDVGYRSHIQKEFWLYTYEPLRFTKFNNNQDEIKELFVLFTKNLFYYISNNPWIPWAFNAPNDNTCGRIMTTYSMFEENMRSFEHNALNKIDKNAFTSKCWAITLRPEYGTFEFRFFGMPKTAKELTLHVSLAKAIFMHCLVLTMKRIKLKPVYSKWEDLTKITYKKSLQGLKNCCTELNISFDELERMGKVNNLELRYAFHKEIMRSEKFIPDNMVLN